MGLSRLAIVELQQAAEAAVALDWPGAFWVGAGMPREEDDVVLPLVRSFAVVMPDEVAARGQTVPRRGAIADARRRRPDKFRLSNSL